MDKILNEVNSVFQLVSTIPVSGDSVDVMAVVRNKLRTINAELKKIKAEGGVKSETEN